MDNIIQVSTKLTSSHINPRGDNTVQQILELLPRDFCDLIPRELILVRFSDIPDYLLYSSLSTSTIVDLYALANSNLTRDLLLTIHAKIDVNGEISFFYADQRDTSPYQGKHFTFSRSETLVNILKNFPEY